MDPKFPQHPLNSPIPKMSTADIGHHATVNSMRVDIFKLIDLTEGFPVVDVDVDQLTHELDDQCWTDQNERKISPSEVVKKYENSGRSYDQAAKKFPELKKHLYQTMNADLSHPIIISQGIIIDGMHL